MAPLVSVVLTAYNRAEPLRRTIETLISQSFGDFELLLCDDASTDHTEIIGREYEASDERVIYHRSERNRGMPENLNEGIRRSRGTYVANLHDGDLYDPALLEKWTAALQNNPRAAFVFNQYRILNADASVRLETENLPDTFPGHHLLERVYFRRWRLTSPIWGTVMARRTAYMEAGLFDPRFGCVADVDMWMRLAESYDVAYVNEPLITIPCREILPSNWPIRHDLARQMFWEARMRHYKVRSFRRYAEALRHAAFAAASQASSAVCQLKAALIRPGWHPLQPGI